MTIRVLALAALAIAGASLVGAADPAKPEGTPAGKLAHMVALPDDLKWGPQPPVLPLGAQLAVLDGDPSKEGLFTIRLKAPNGYVIPPHWHPTEENVTVISGSFGIGIGDKFDKTKVRYMPAGSYVRLGKEERHFAVIKGETIIQVHANGPFELTYVDPTDDPRKKDK